MIALWGVVGAILGVILTVAAKTKAVIAFLLALVLLVLAVVAFATGADEASALTVVPVAALLTHLAVTGLLWLRQRRRKVSSAA